MPQLEDIDLDLDIDFDDESDFDMDSDMDSDMEADESGSGSGDIEAESKHGLNELQRGFISRSNAEKDRRAKATDSEFWVCLCFQNREQVEAFLKSTKFGDPSEKYIDGRRVAAKLNVALPGDGAPFGTVKIDKKLAALAAKE